ncbi:hypothetical protein [Maribellus mangrovi]|uniref:hypothetical protein n=1 Tax=Maribellus mangrovi TaxID=3133146 RepID=UPI0030EE0016
MKTLRVFLTVFFFLGIIGVQAQAQEKSNRVEQGWFESGYWSPIFCDGEMVDLLEGGTLRIHYVMRYEPFVIYKEIDQLKGTVTSSVTGEVFKVRETDKHLGTPDFYMLTWRFNLIGNQGTHYNGYITVNMRTGEIVDFDTVCH